MTEASRLVLHGALAASFWLFVATLPPFHIGLWVDSEATLVGLYFLITLMGVGLFLHAMREPLKYSRRTWLLGSTCLLSAFVTLWAGNKALHHYGAPMTGEGTALWVGLTLMSLAYDQLDGARLRWIKLSACLAACVAGVLVLCNNSMHWLGWYPEWAPYMFAAFLAPMALVVALCGWLAAAVPLLVVSHNKTLILAVMGACAAWWVLRNRSVRWRVAIVMALPLGVIALDFVGQYIWDARYGAGADNLVMDQWWSLRSRALSIMVYLLSWVREPWNLLFGYGWGSYFEHLQQNITSLPIALFHNGSWQPNWDGIDRIDFHVMHQGLEHLFSLGVCGLVLYVGLLLLPFYKAGVTFRRFIVAVGFASVTSTWFTLAIVWPYWMLAWVLVMPQGQVTLLKDKAMPMFCVVLGGLVVVQAGWNQWQTAAIYPTHEKSLFQHLTYSESRPGVEKWERAYNVHGFHMAYFVFNLLSKKDQIPTDTLLSELAPALSIYNAQKSTLLLDISMLHVMKFLAAQDAQYGEMWSDVVKAILRKAPRRSDMAETYIQYALQHGRTQDVEDMVNSLLQSNPADRCALWYKGLLLTPTPQKEEGFTCMRQALLLGAEKWIPTS